MRDQVRLLGEAHEADVALVGAPTRVGAHVDHQVVALLEGRRTRAAPEGPVHGVASDVAHQDVLVGEGHGAERALQGLLACVRPLVDDHVLPPVGHVTALVTRVEVALDRLGMADGGRRRLGVCNARGLKERYPSGYNEPSLHTLSKPRL